MKSELAFELDLAGMKVQYDVHTKRILANRYILAWILKCSVKEFQKLDVFYIAERCIQGNIEISQVPVLPGQSNLSERIRGDNTEDKVPYEGLITYDIRFHAVLPASYSQLFKLLLNLEAQKDYYPGYPLVTRGIYYGARMLSAQLGTEFQIPHYENLKKVYSIWICMNAPRYVGNAITEYHIEKSDRYQALPFHKSDYDKLSVVMIGLNQEKKGEGIFRLLNILLSETVPAQEKISILAKEFSIPMEYEDFGKELQHMCNVGELLVERSIARGLSQGLSQGLAQGEERFAALVRFLLDSGRHNDLEPAATDVEYRARLYEEFHL